MKSFIFLLILSTIKVNAKIKCANNDDCSIENTICSNNDTCICNIGYIFSYDETVCLPYVTQYHGECEEDVQCSWLGSNSNCRYNLCMCAENYRWFQGQCRQYVGLGENCTDTVDCYDGYNLLSLTCTDEGTCNCSADYYLRENIDCRKIAKSIGDSCALNSDCSYSLGDAICSNGQCKSINNYNIHPIPNTIKAEQEQIEPIDLIYCDATDDCSTLLPNSECYANTGTCVCKPGFYLGTNNNQCIAELGVDIQCTDKSDTCQIQASTCIEGACFCLDYWFTDDGNRNCIKTMSQNNWNCLSKEWCYALGPHSYCSKNETCECSRIAELVEDHTNDYLYCNQVSEDDSLCKTDYECDEIIRNSVCMNEECQCNDNYREEDGWCLPNIGSPCDNNEFQCTLDNSECLNNTCSCIQNYVTESNITCYPVADGLNEHCDLNAQCSAVIPNSMCDTNTETCACEQDYTPKNNTCYEKKYFGSYCTNIIQCTAVIDDTLVCRNSKCQCVTGYVFQDNKCIESSSSSSSSKAARNINNIIIFITALIIFRHR